MTIMPTVNKTDRKPRFGMKETWPREKELYFSAPRGAAMTRRAAAIGGLVQRQ